MIDSGSILAILAAVAAAAVFVVRALVRKAPTRERPNGAQTTETEAAERKTIDEAIEAATTKVEEIDRSDDHERTAAAGSRLRD